MYRIIARILIVTYVIFITAMAPMEWCLNGNCTNNALPGLCITSSSFSDNSSDTPKTKDCGDCGDEDIYTEDDCKRIDDLHQSEGPIFDLSPIVIETANTIIAFIEFTEYNSIPCTNSYAYNLSPTHAWTQFKAITVLHI